MKFLKLVTTPFAIGVSTIVASSVLAATILSLGEVNQKVSALTAPFNNKTTSMNLAFTALTIDATRTLNFGVTGLVSKKGPADTVALNIKKAEYAYGDGTKPTLDVELDLDVDLVRAFGQKMLNDISADLHSIVEDVAKDYTEDYGPAVTVTATEDAKQLDTAGNVESMKLSIAAVIDPTKLPAAKPIEKVEFQTINVELQATRTKITMKMNVVANPKFERFQQNGEGLKEFVEKLLTDDAKTYQELHDGLTTFDSIAKWLAEMKPN